MPLATLHIVDRVPDLDARVAQLVASALPEAREGLSRMKLVTHCMELTAQNLAEKLLPLFRESQAVMDLTTVVDSEAGEQGVLCA